MGRKGTYPAAPAAPRKPRKPRAAKAAKVYTSEGVPYTPRDTDAGRRDVLLTVRLAPAERERLHERARSKGLSVTAYLRNLIARDAREDAQRENGRLDGQ